MPFATGPWHSPPQLPDDPEELCLVLLFHRGEHHRYVAMRYADGWTYQDGQVMEAGTWVSRWAYITSSVERLSELPPVQELPPESRLFVHDALTAPEQLRFLCTYVAMLKKDIADLHAELESTKHGSAIRTLQGELKSLENMRHSQVASKERRIEEQRAALVEMHEQIQKLKSQLAKAELRTQDLIQREAKQRRSAHTELGKLKQELNRLRMKLEKAR
ncbi:MAG: hypothetical protein WBB32_09560 [Flavobacteriales bacterium]|nr:hypothetical protein [Flavobacteriales bacterium]MBZ0207562.1 hypothetical protein [Flavobacteriales bacterium]